MPGLERGAQAELHAAIGNRTETRKAEFKEGLVPGGLKRIAARGQLIDDFTEIIPHEPRQHEAVMQLRAPVDEFVLVGLVPEARYQGPQQQHLGQAHARMGRHFKGTEFEQTAPPAAVVGRIELVDAELGAMGVAGQVDELIAHHAVHQPRRDIVVTHGQLAEGGGQFMQAVVTRLVDAGCLAGRADEQAGKQVGQRRMVLPVAHQAAEQMRTTQQR